MLKYNYFPGCTLKTTATQLEETSIKVLQQLGVELVELPRWHCCGTVVSLSSDTKIHSAGAIRTLIRAQETGDNKLVTICSVCYNTLKRVNERFNTDEDFRETLIKFMDDEEPYEGKIEVLHLVDVIREIGLDNIEDAVINPLKGLKVACYYGCLLLRPSEFSIDPSSESPRILEDIIASVGGEPVEFPQKIECCGAFETVHNPTQIAAMGYRIIESARKNGAEVLTTMCPLCYFNLDRTQKIIKKTNPSFIPLPLFYHTELMAMAILPEEISLKENVELNSTVLERIYS